MKLQGVHGTLSSNYRSKGDYEPVVSEAQGFQQSFSDNVRKVINIAGNSHATEDPAKTCKDFSDAGKIGNEVCSKMSCCEGYLLAINILHRSVVFLRQLNTDSCRTNINIGVQQLDVIQEWDWREE